MRPYTRTGRVYWSSSRDRRWCGETSGEAAFFGNYTTKAGYARTLLRTLTPGGGLPSRRSYDVRMPAVRGQKSYAGLYVTMQLRYIPAWYWRPGISMTAGAGHDVVVTRAIDRLLQRSTELAGPTSLYSGSMCLPGYSAYWGVATAWGFSDDRQRECAFEWVNLSQSLSD